MTGEEPKAPPWTKWREGLPSHQGAAVQHGNPLHFKPRPDRFIAEQTFMGDKSADAAPGTFIINGARRRVVPSWLVLPACKFA